MLRLLGVLRSVVSWRRGLPLTHQVAPQPLGVLLGDRIQREGCFKGGVLLAGADRHQAQASQSMPELGFTVHAADAVAADGTVFAYDQSGAAFHVVLGDAVAGFDPAQHVVGGADHAPGRDGDHRPEGAQGDLHVEHQDRKGGRQQGEQHA